MSSKERHFQGIMREIFNFSKIPPRRKDYQINLSSIFSGNHRFPITEFSGNCSKLILPELFSGNRVTNISGNPCSSPSHIASDPAKLSGHSMELNPQKLFPVTMLPIFPVIPTKLFPQTKKAAGHIFGGGGG